MAQYDGPGGDDVIGVKLSEEGLVSRRVVLGGLAALAVAAVGGVVAFESTRYSAGPPHRGHLALRAGTVLHGADLSPVPDAIVLIRDGVIEAVGHRREVRVSSDAQVIDVGGMVALPGLIDLHVHLGSPEREPGDDPGRLSMPRLVADWIRHMPGVRRALLGHGVTSVRSLGDDYGWITELRDLVDTGELEGPRVFAAGPVFTTPGGHPVATFGAEPDSDFVRIPDSPESARAAVRELATGVDRVDLIKIIQDRGGMGRALEPIPPELLAAIVEEAHRHGLTVTAHWGTPEDLTEVLAAGVDGLEHVEARGALDGGWPSDVLRLLLDRGIPLTPTVAVTDAALPAEIAEALRSRVGELHAAGVRVVAGSDAPMQGVPFGGGLHRELELLVDSGLSARASLRAATSAAADVLGAEHIGRLEAGCAADVVVVGASPVDDITSIRDVVLVLRDGRMVVDRRRVR